MNSSWDPPTREKILEALRRTGDPIKPDDLADELGVLKPAHREILERRLGAMERDGQLLPNRKGVLLLASKLDFVAGRVIGHRDGFGFMRPDQGGPDLFLPQRQMQKVMHGDRVLVKLAGQDNRGRPEAAIVEVTERANRRLVGRFLNERGVFLVVPEDQRIKHDILIAPSHTSGASAGQVVTCEIIDPPTRNTQPIGRVVEVLGEVGDAGMEIEIAVRKFDVPFEFGDAVREQALALDDVVADADVRGRIDLRDVPLLTIDGADARDFDDAVYCEPVYSVGKKPRLTGYRLLVAIADVGHYVQPGTPLDDEAMNRSTSVYFPRRVIPMLPEKLSNGLCSLNPMVDRLAMVCDMTVNLKGKVRGYQFYEAVMHSAARTTYDQVWQILSGRTTPGDSPVARTLNDEQLEERLVCLQDLFQVFVGAREQRGALEFETIETRIECDSAGRILRIVPTKRNDAHRIIEECMLAANVCAADYLKRHKHPTLYRVHEGPTKEKLTQLRSFLRSCSLSLAGGDDPSPADYGELSRKIAGRPDSTLLQTMMLRSMQQAVYTPENNGHFGLAFDAYAHFTSPIRRYPDLLVHRAIKACLNSTEYVPALSGSMARQHSNKLSESGAKRTKGRAAVTKPVRPVRDKKAIEAAWTTLGQVCSTNERRADEASRDVEAWLKCQFVRDRVGDEFTGRITGVAPFGIFVTLDTLYVEGMVHVSELGSEYFQFNEAGHELRGERTGTRFRLTDSVSVQVARVDLEARRIEFRLGAQMQTGKKSPKSPNASNRTSKPKKAAPKPGAKVRSAQAARTARKKAAGSGKPQNKAKARKQSTRRGKKKAK